MSCGVGCRHGFDLMLLWLWYRLAAVAPVGPLTWELSYAVGAALKSKKKKKKKPNQKTPHEKPNLDLCVPCCFLPLQWTNVLIMNINRGILYQIFSDLLFEFNAMSWRSLCPDKKSWVCIPECGCTINYLTVLYCWLFPIFCSKNSGESVRHIIVNTNISVF